jgi:NAD(P)-dependent dehydrogenase (short-subunit alcohol dehydrogenase family)
LSRGCHWFVARFLITGAALAAHEVSPVLGTGWGLDQVIIAVSGPEVATTGSPAFSATRVAVRSFARTWSVDLKERNIRMNAISPGIIHMEVGFPDKSFSLSTGGKQSFT